MNIRLKLVTKTDIDFLYELLSKRDKIENISHKKMPTFSKHKKFVLSNPYQKWYIVILEKQKIGSVYLSQINEIGLHLLKQFDNKKIKNEVLQILFEKNPRNRYLVNINPNNSNSIKFFKNKNFKLIQHTFELS